MLKLIHNTEDLSLTSDLMELGEIARQWHDLKPENEQVKALVRLAVDINVRMIKLQVERDDLMRALESQREQKLEAKQEYSELFKIQRDTESILKKAIQYD